MIIDFRRRWFVVVLTLSAIVAPSCVSAWAGGPSRVGVGDQPVRWAGAHTNFVIDNGPLGTPNCPTDCYTRDEAAAKVRQAFQVWADVSSSTLQVEDRGFLPVDVATPDDFNEYTSAKRPEGNPIIFDDAGAITDYFYGNDSTDILGFASTKVDSTGTQFDFGYAVLNGANTDYSGFFATFIHEFGHLLGLGHTQAGHSFVSNSTLWNKIPLMYPILVPSGTKVPLQDDIAWLSWLYPEPSFQTSTGTIKGRVFLPSGEPLPGANVVAVRLDAEMLETTDQTSCVSDFLTKGDGSYEIPGLAPGNYYVFIEPLDPEFVGGSGVGPYDTRFTNFLKDYYNGAAESNSDNPGDRIPITVAAGESVDNIDVTANEIYNRLDLLTDDGEMRFDFPEGFTFPFYGTTYSEVWVNSDGSLTFTRGDGIVGEPRTPERFLGGPPRIAPLFTDLDPSAGGEIQWSYEPGALTFTWMDVPEFSDTFAQPNRFSVTLYSNGDIRFHYTQVKVTADADNGPASQWLQAIVGISPGGLASGSEIDLSASLTNKIGAEPIYQIFRASSFDLQGQDVLFQGAENRLMFPFYRGNSSTFTGFAISNHSAGDAEIVIKAYGGDGSLLPFAQNPRTVTLPVAQQMAQLGTEIFGIPMATVQNGWVEMTSQTRDLASFFEFGNGLAGPLTQMDGSTAWNTQATTLYFTRIYDGAGTFPAVNGSLDCATTITVANPNEGAITVQFTLYDVYGVAITQTDRTIPAHGMVRARVSTLMGGTGALSNGYLKAQVTQGLGAIGFELIQLTGTVLGLNASVGNTSNAAYSAQLASGALSGGSIFTDIKLVNTSSSTRVVTITPYSNDGVQLAEPLTNQSIAADASLQFDTADVFAGFGFSEPVKVGSLVISADGPGVIGDVVFGEPARGDYAAALPLQTTLLRKAVFSQVANGNLDPAGDPRLDTFTGIALFNPNNTVVEVTLKVFDHEGAQLGNISISLQPNQRISDLIENLISGTSTLVRGYVSIESTLPIAAQELFGNAALTFMSAVPPYVMQ